MCEKRTLPRWCKDVKHQLIERDRDGEEDRQFSGGRDSVSGDNSLIHLF